MDVKGNHLSWLLDFLCRTAFLAGAGVAIDYDDNLKVLTKNYLNKRYKFE